MQQKVALVSCATQRAEKVKQMVQSAHGSYHGLDVTLTMQGEHLRGTMLRAVDKATEGVTWIEFKKGKGTAKGLNRALKNALKNDADLIVVCHSDVKFEGDAITRMVESWGQADTPGMMGPLTDNAKSKIGQTAHDPAFREDSVERTSHLDGFCFMTSREVIAAVGMFDERLPPHWGWDVDYCLRVKIAGYGLYLDRGAFAYHLRWDIGTDRGLEESNGIKYLEDKYGADKMQQLTGEIDLSEGDRAQAREKLAKSGKLVDCSDYAQYARQ